MDRKCKSCNRKTHLILKCRCEHMFCVNHIQAEYHDCVFDYVGESRQKLAAENPKIKTRKLNTI